MKKLLPFIVLLFLPLQSHAVITMPFSTTYDCDEWTTYSATLDCDGIGKKGSYTVTYDGSTHYEEIISAANNPAGGGGRGQRHYIGTGSGGSFIMTGGLTFTFPSTQRKLWIRWYQRWEAGFTTNWNTYKQFFFRDTGAQRQAVFHFDGDGSIDLNPPDFATNTTGVAYGDNFYTPSGISDGSWQCFEIHFDMDAGTFKFWHEDTLYADVTGVDFTGVSAIQDFLLPSNGNYSDSEVRYIDYDDIAINNTGQIGCLGAGGSAPVRTNGSPTSPLASGTTNTTMSITTDTTSTCKYSLTPGTAYADMENTFAVTNSTSHSTSITGLTDSYSNVHYVRCDNGTSNTTDYEITIEVAPFEMITSGSTSLIDTGSSKLVFDVSTIAGAFAWPFEEDFTGDEPCINNGTCDKRWTLGVGVPRADDATSCNGGKEFNDECLYMIVPEGEYVYAELVDAAELYVKFTFAASSLSSGESDPIFRLCDDADCTTELAEITIAELTGSYYYTYYVGGSSKGSSAAQTPGTGAEIGVYINNTDDTYEFTLNGSTEYSGSQALSANVGAITLGDHDINLTTGNFTYDHVRVSGSVWPPDINFGDRLREDFTGTTTCATSYTCDKAWTGTNTGANSNPDYGSSYLNHEYFNNDYFESDTTSLTSSTLELSVTASPITYTRLALNIEALPDAGDIWVSENCTASCATNVGGIKLSRSGSTYTLAMYVADTSVDTKTVSLDTPYLIEYYLNDTAGTWEWRVNELVEGSGSTDPANSTAYVKIGVDGSTNTTIWIDNVAVDTGGYPGYPY